MTKPTRRNHVPVFKAKVALATLKGKKTLTELAQLYDVHPNQITIWKARLAESGMPAAEAGPAVDLQSLHAKIRELTLEHNL